MEAPATQDAPAPPAPGPAPVSSKSPSLEDGEVPEDDGPPPAPPPPPPAPPQPQVARSPPLRPHAYGPGAQQAMSAGPLPPQDRLWERERDSLRERERDRDRDRDRELLRERERERDRERERQVQREREREKELQRERDRLREREQSAGEHDGRDKEMREPEQLVEPELQDAELPVEERQLDVTDALSYLDMVKAQFNEQPEIYNKFLDTMKQFKSEQINTPGVIDRVSELFAGHPQLIQGFNAFLPHGYRIEVSTSSITVTTPSGTRTQAPPRPVQPVQPIPVVLAAAVPGPSTPRSMHQEREQREREQREREREQRERERAAQKEARERDRKMREQREWEAQQQQQQMLAPPLQAPPVQPQPDPPFNAAMDYVNRIKHRFHDEPDIYRQFLDVLQTYQRGGQTDSAVVFQQVTVLFRGNQDLIEEFKKFVNFGGEDGGMMMGGAAQDVDMDRERPDRRKRTTTDASKRKRRPVDRNDENTRLPAPRPPKKQRTEKVEQQMQPPSGQWMREPSPPPISNIRGQGHAHSHQYQQQHHHHHHQSQQVAPSAPPPPDESTFFARVGDVEFMRLARDFARGDRGVDLRALVEYLGDSSLGVEFREIIGWPSFLNPVDAANGVPAPGAGEGVWSLATAGDDGELGPSYRRLPKSEVGRPMSGRDDMCREVLNDEFVSHPSWAPGYNIADADAELDAAEEKNAYERALHRSEEERHEFDYAIDALSRTFLALDVALTRVQGMATPEERAAHKFKGPLLGACLKPIHTRTIRRVYGAKAGGEVLQALHDNPLVAIPVVTNTLRRKEDEWKRVQRAWNRVWRGVEARNFFESWDHEGATARARDAQATSSRHIIEELEEARGARVKRVAALADPALRGAEEEKGDWRAALEYTDVLQDALKLVFAFLDQLPRSAGVDKGRVEGLLRFFTPLVVAGHEDAWDAAFGTASEQESEAERAAAVKKKAKGGKGKKNGVVTNGNGNSLLLMSNGDTLATPASEITSPLVQPMDVDKQEAPEPTPAQPAKKSLVFFADRKLFALLRLLEFLYSRLAHFSNIAHTLSTVESGSSYLEHPLAVQLGLGRALPALAQAYGGLPERFYDVLLESIESLFAGEMPEATFHANMRMMFGFESVKLLSIDRIVGAVVKQVQVVLADKRSRHLVGLLHRQRGASSDGLAEWNVYRRAAEEEVGDESLVFVRVEANVVTAQLLLPGDTLPQDTERVKERWQAYLELYARKQRTKGVKKPKLPFLYRNLPRSKDAWSRDKSRLSAKRELEAKIDQHSYRLYFVGGTEEVVVRRWKKDERAAAETRALRRAEEARGRLDKFGMQPIL